jgi:hypothetical protein
VKDKEIATKVKRKEQNRMKIMKIEKERSKSPKTDEGFQRILGFHWAVKWNHQQWLTSRCY